MKALVAAFNQEKALVGAFSVITNLRMELFGALVGTQHRDKIIPAPDKNAILMRPHHLKFPAGDHVWRHRCGRSVILVTTAIVKY